MFKIDIYFWKFNPFNAFKVELLAGGGQLLEYEHGAGPVASDEAARVADQGADLARLGGGRARARVLGEVRVVGPGELLHGVGGLELGVLEQQDLAVLRGH